MRSHPIGNGLCTPRIPRELAALIAALQLKGATVEGLLELDQREWESLLNFCEPAHLTLLLAQVAVSDFPSWVTERLEKNVADNSARFERVKATYQEAAAALDEAGVDHIVLKGFTQAPDYCGDARLRMQSDLDFYCPSHMIERARDILMTLGYQSDLREDSSHADHLPKMIRLGNWQWRGNALDPEMPLSIELHFCLWNEAVSGFSVPDMDLFWERRTMRSLEGMLFPDLHPVDHLGYLALHTLRNLLSGEWIIHHVHEIATFLHNHAKDDMFWKAWKGMHSKSFRALQCIAFFHAKCWFCCDVPHDVQSEIAAMPLLYQEWLGRFTGAALESMFRKNKDRVWLYVNLVDSTRKKLEIIQQIILPTLVAGVQHIDSPSIRIKNRQITSATSNRYVDYIGYLFDRAVDHLRTFPALLFHGLALWLSLHQPRKQFHQ